MTPTPSTSQSQRLYDHIVASGLEHGRIFAYHELDAALGRPLARGRSVLYSTLRKLEAEHQRTLVAMPRVGYRIAAANETPTLARTRVTRGEKQIKRGLHTALHTDETALTQIEREELHRCRSGLEALRSELSRVKRRMGHAEARIDELEQQPRLSEQEVAMVRQLLAVQPGP